ncbi:MAG: prepilin peptidase [Sphingomonas sp.]
MPPSVFLCAAALTAILVHAAWGDVRTRQIPNWIPAAIALIAPFWWWASGVPSWSALGWQVGVAVVLALLLFAAWTRGMIGGGDVKLLAALALWFAPLPLLQLLTVMAIAGGGVTVLALIEHRVRRRPGPPEVPYGVAIAFAGLWAMTNEFLTSSVQ